MTPTPSADPPPGAPSAPAAWPFRVLLALALLLPALLIGAFALHDRAATLNEGAQTARRTVSALTEHAAKVLETHALVLEHVDAQARDRGWDQIEADRALRQRLGDVAGALAQVEWIAMYDAQGRLRTHGPGLRDPGASAAERGWFAAHRDGLPGRLYVGEPFSPRGDGRTLIAVSMRRSTGDGGFDGVVAIAVSTEYFTRFWEQFAPSVAHEIPLMRADGTMLVRTPAAPAGRLAPEAPFMRRIAEEPAGGFHVASHDDGVERMTAFSRVGRWPLYVSFSVETDALLEPWRQRLRLFATLGAVTSFALAALVTLAARESRRHRAEARRWQDAAERFREEIARRERAEAELVQAQKMEAVGRLTGGVAHDFNNLLHAMGLNVALAGRAAAGGPAAPFLDGIRRGIERASRLTQQLTAFSRRQPLEPRAFDVGERLADMAEMLSHTLGGTIELELAGGDGVGPAFADPNQAELALLNLAVNARDAMPAGGRLSIRAANVSLRSPAHRLAAGEYVAIAVADSGTGMPADVVARAFEPFFTTKEVGKGSGLGLSMVHGFASQSGGGVTIDSCVGRGTTVTLWLPRAPAGPAADEAVAPDAVDAMAAAPKGARVLLVDDDALVRSATVLSLREAGWAVDEASCGEDALDALHRERYDVLVTDFAMPGMDGAELARLATGLHAGLPTVLVTGHARRAVVGSRPVHRFGAVLHKPCSPQQVADAIDSVLHGTARVRERETEPG